MLAKLGTAETSASTALRILVPEPPVSSDFEFRNAVTDLVLEILTRHYVTQRDAAEREALRWGLTLEQLVAAAVSHHVMKKIDAEYV